MPPILRRMMANLGKSRYSGVRVVEFREETQRQRNTELVWVDGLRSRTEFTGDSPMAGQVIVEVPGKRLHYMPDTNEILQLPPRRSEMGERMLKLMRMGRQPGFKFEVVPGGEVAGQPTLRVSLVDRFGNATSRIWIDEGTGLALKRELFDPAGARVGYFEFTRINYRPVLESSDFEIRRKGAKVVTMDEQLVSSARSLEMPPYRLPASSGYVLERVRPLKMPDRKVLSSTYTGKGGRVTLFQSEGKVDPDRMGKFGGRKLETHVFRVDSRNFVLIGDVTKAELERLAKTVTR